ncbi:hypothetical protein UlMin_009376 [Ulmus minor]
MAASLLPLLCFSLSLFSFSLSKKALIFPVTKDSLTLQYLTQIRHGNPLQPTKLVLDLGAPLIWMDCEANSGSGSSSGRLISCGSIQCLAAKSTVDKLKKMGNGGKLVEDIVAVDLAGEITAGEYSFLFVCSPKSLLNGLAIEARGMVGLGRSRIALPSQISQALASKWQFSLCLSSSNGVVLYENGHQSSYFGSELSKSLIYTPLLQDGSSSSQYFINLKSIQIGGKKLSLDLKSTKLSTIVPYTTMATSIYTLFVKAYEKAASSLNMTRVESVAPFGLCFASETIRRTAGGQEVPVIDLTLQSEMVKWRIYGRNSMVKVSDKVVCLGFLDGGLNMEESVVLGGFQLEDVLLHFDVGASMLGFSPSLLLKQTSCSNFNLDSTSIESL